MILYMPLQLMMTYQMQVFVASVTADRSLLDVAAPTAVVHCSCAALLRSPTWDIKQLLAEVHHFGAPRRVFCHSRRSSCTRSHRGNMHMPSRREEQAVLPR
jgi:hypothetical protein